MKQNPLNMMPNNEWEWYRMAYKCSKTLANKGFSGIYAIWKKAAATLLQHVEWKVQKGIVAGSYDVKKGAW